MTETQPINVIILAAGYGTRLTSQIQNLKNSDPEKFQKYEKLLNLSKALLPIGKKPLIAYWLDYLLRLHVFGIHGLEAFTDIDLKNHSPSEFIKNEAVKNSYAHPEHQKIQINKFIIVTNDKFFNQFNKFWSDLCLVESSSNCAAECDLSHVLKQGEASRRDFNLESEFLNGQFCLSKLGIDTYLEKLVDIEILNDGSLDNSTRLGCNRSINFAMEKSIGYESKTPCLVLASDLLFTRPFNLSKFFKKSDFLPGVDAKISGYQIPNSRVEKHGIIETRLGRVTKFLEKPDPDSTKSRIASPCFYLLKHPALLELQKFCALPNCPDASGHFLKNLVDKNFNIYVQNYPGRFDIGDLDSFIDCHQHY